MRALQYLHPSYYEKFSCIGGACEDTCCQEWLITIDKSTYFDMKKIKDPEFAGLFSKHVRRMKKRDDHQYAQFLLDEEGFCPFLTEDKLCGIQKNHGYRLLCTTCQIYPRRCARIMDNYLELALYMSCPEAVRVALLDPEPITFLLSDTTSNEALMRRNVIRMIHEKDGKVPPEIVWSVREVCIDILQSRNLPVADRLFALGMMLKKVDEQLRAGAQDLERTLITYLQAVKQGEFAGRLEGFDYEEDIQIAMKYTVYNSIARHVATQKKDGVTYRWYMERFARDQQESGKLEMDKDGSTHFRYNSADVESLRKIDQFTDKQIKKNWKRFLDEREYVLENYFVNQVFLMAFPFTYKSAMGIYHHIYVLAEQYALMRILLSTCVDENGAVSEEVLTKVLMSMSVNSSHNSEAKVISENYRDKGLDSLLHLAHLLR